MVREGFNMELVISAPGMELFCVNLSSSILVLPECISSGTLSCSHRHTDDEIWLSCRARIIPREPPALP